MKYIIRDKEAGNEISEFVTLAEAEAELAAYEEEDKKDGTYTPDFYEIVVDQTVAERVTDLRKRAGCTQKGFADRYNIPLRTVQNWEYGINEAPDYLLDLIEKDITQKRPRLKLSLDYTNGTHIERIVHYVHVENGKLWHAVVHNPSPVVVTPVGIPLENLISWDVELQ